MSILRDWKKEIKADAHKYDKENTVMCLTVISLAEDALKYIDSADMPLMFHLDAYERLKRRAEKLQSLVKKANK